MAGTDMQHLHMYLGEIRRATVTVSSKARENFVITDPTYKLRIRGILEAEGIPEVYGHDMFIMVEPKTAGTYLLETKFFIAGEKLIRRVEIEVEK